MAVYPTKYDKKTNWQEGDYVTAANMNKIEQGIYDSEVYTDEAIAALVSAKQGTSAPTTSTVGTIGQKYLNTSTKNLYECVGISSGTYTWKLVYKWNSTDSKYYLVDADGDEIDVSALESEIAEIVASLADAYDNAHAYVKGDIVSYQGKLYKAKAATTGHVPTNTTYWEETTMAEVLDKKANIDGHYSSMTVGLAEGIESTRVIEDADVSCPPITFGTTGGGAEVQTGNNKFKFLFGKSQKWNQKIKNPNFAVNSNWGDYLYVSTISISNNTLTATANNQYNYVGFGQAFQCIANHKYFFSINISAFTSGIELRGGLRTNAYKVLKLGVNNFVLDTTATPNEVGVYSETGTSGSSISCKWFWMVDLTEMDYDMTGLTNEQIAEKFVKDYPLDYYDYNQSTILSAKSSELVSVGENQWDEEYLAGYGLNTTNGTVAADSNRITSKNFIRVFPDTEYFYTMDDGATGLAVCYYDANQNFISGNWYTPNSALTTPSNAYFIKFTRYPSESYNGGINIYICWDTPGRPYVANRTERVTLPNIELRSVVVADGTEKRDEAYQEGGGKRYVGFVRIVSETNVWGTYNGAFYCGFSNFSSLPYKQVTSSKNFECNTLKAFRQNSGISGLINSGGRGSLALRSDQQTIQIYPDSSIDSADKLVTWLKNNPTYLLYELATETDIPTSENPGWTELVYTDNYGTLQFNTSPAQIPQVPQPYYIEYTVSLTDYLDAAYAHTDGDATKIALKQDVEDIVNGNTPAGKALLADNLESNNKIEDLLPYTMRQAPSGVGKSMLLDHLTGATVAWNQLGKAINSTNWTTSDATATFSNGVATFTANQYRGAIVSSDKTLPAVANHIVLFYADVKLTTATTDVRLYAYGGYATKNVASTTSWQTITTRIRTNSSWGADLTSRNLVLIEDVRTSGWDAIQVRNVMAFDLTQIFGSTIADYLYNQGEAGVNKFRNLFPKPYYPYNAGELVGIKTAGRKAVGINQWDEQWEVGTIDNVGENISSSVVIRSKNYIKVIPNQTYYFYVTSDSSQQFKLFYYDANKNFIKFDDWSATRTRIIPSNCSYVRFVPYTDYGTTYNHDICINISDPAINGTFYPYEADEYPCEEVELNGYYTLDSNNNIVATGDTYANDGKIIRTFIEYNFGDLNWVKSTNGRYFQATVSVDASAHSAPAFCSKYYNSNDNGSSVYEGTQDKVFNVAGLYIGADYHTIYVRDTAYSDAATFKSANADVKIVYKVATPTEETASSFASTQKTGVTEQFIEPETPSTVFLPVGHDSFYLPDLKDKLEVAPDSPTTDGTYLVSRSGGTNVYIPIANVTATQAEIDEIIAILE